MLKKCLLILLFLSALGFNEASNRNLCRANPPSWHDTWIKVFVLVESKSMLCMGLYSLQ